MNYGQPSVLSKEQAYNPFYTGASDFSPSSGDAFNLAGSWTHDANKLPYNTASKTTQALQSYGFDQSKPNPMPVYANQGYGPSTEVMTQNGFNLDANITDLADFDIDEPYLNDLLEPVGMDDKSHPKGSPQITGHVGLCQNCGIKLGLTQANPVADLTMANDPTPAVLTREPRNRITLAAISRLPR